MNKCLFLTFFIAYAAEYVEQHTVDQNKSEVGQSWSFIKWFQFLYFYKELRLAFNRTNMLVKFKYKKMFFLNSISMY